MGIVEWRKKVKYIVKINIEAGVAGNCMPSTLNSSCLWQKYKMIQNTEQNDKNKIKFEKLKEYENIYKWQYSTEHNLNLKIQCWDTQK